MASAARTTARTTNGVWTVPASAAKYVIRSASPIAPISSDVRTVLPRMNAAPTSGAMVVPSELNACARLRRDEAVRAGPSAATYGLAATCRTVIPPARTNIASKNSA